MLKKSLRLPSKKIPIILKEGRRSSHPLINLFLIKNNLDFSRFAVLVPPKISKKPSKRNPLRRKTYEIIRKNRDKIQPGYDFILIFKKNSQKLSSKDIQEIIFSLFKKANFY